MTVDDTSKDELEARSDESDFDDPLLRALASAPAIGLREAYLPEGFVIGETYRIARVIGAGAMGVVYEAVDTILDRKVALKVHDLGKSSRAARLWREARTLARLTHPNVVVVHDVGVDGQHGYIAMELVVGTHARAWLAGRTRSWREILDVYLEAARGLAAAHA
ncbi:MAG TPA: protein kinase, partial [Nannocystaceae bacterium]|nr:protein kinase [Nannocystaceae bacterium]